MTNKKSTKRALLASVIALMLCVAMLAGTTYAWFTDNVVSNNNIIKAGNLDVELYWSTDASDWKKVDATTNVFTNQLWEPGHTEVVYLKIENAGSLALKYNLGINVVSETVGTNVANEEFKLSDYIKFAAIKDVTTAYADRDAAIDAAIAANPTALSAGYLQNGWIAADANDHYVALVVYMPTDVGNDANYKTGTEAPVINLGINLFATQMISESDSFGADYDENAPWTGYANTAWYNDTDTTFALSSAEELAGLAVLVNNGNSFAGKTITLDKDIDLNDLDWTPIGNKSQEWKSTFNGSFNGNGYTISNLKVVGTKGVGLFGYVGNAAHFENVTIDGAYVKGNDYVGALMGSGYLAANCIKGCKVIGAEIIAVPYLMADGETYDGGAKAGAIAGYAINGNITGNTVVGCSVTAYRDLGGVAGMVQTESRNLNVTDNAVSNLTLSYITGIEKYADNTPNGNMNQVAGRFDASKINVADNATADVMIGDVLAVDDVADLADVFENGGSAILLADVTVDATLSIPEGKEVVLDLNGKTLSGTTVKQVPVLVNNGELSVKNGTISSTGKCGGAAIVNKGTAVLTDVTLNGAEFGGFDGWWPSYAMNNSGDATLTNVTINSYHGAISASNGANVELNNVTVDVGQDTTTNQTSWVLYAYGNGTITVNSGSYIMTKIELSVNGGGVLCTDATGKIIVNDGTFVKEGSHNNGGSIYVKDNTLVINGGTFDVNPSAYVTDGYEVVDNGNGTWTVNNTFVNISNADGMNDNWDQNILITDDFTVTSENRASANYGLWAYSGIDGNGNTITDNSGAKYAGIYSECTFMKNLTLNTNSLFGVFASAKTDPLVVNNFTIDKSSNGAAFYVQNAPAGITLNDSTITASGVADSAGAANAVVFSTTNSKITINSGTYTATDANGYVVASFYSGSTVTINGGTFNGDLYPVDGGNIVINGGTFNGGFNVLGGNLVINGGTFSVDPSAYVAADKTVTANSNGTWTVQ